MKHIQHALSLMLSLLFGIGLQAQEIVTGSNLDIGSNNTIIENRGNVIGSYHIVNSPGALAVGMGDTIDVNSKNSVALGEYNMARGIATMAFGNYVRVTGSFSSGMGRLLKTNSEYSMTLGNGIVGSGNTPSVFFENNNDYTLMIGFHSTKPTLTVGPSPNDYPNGDHFDLTGKVAIGDVPVPDIAAKLHIRSDVGEDAGILLEPKDMENSNTFIHMRDEGHGIEVDETGELTLRSMVDQTPGSLVLQGRVGVNITNESDTYALAVNGGILTNEVFIKNVDEWFDNVFAENYKLLSLNDLQRYVNRYGHLPEMPSETEVKEEGYNMAEMQGLLLKKIEELTLYTIQQQELIEKLEQRVAELEGK